MNKKKELPIAWNYGQLGTRLKNTIKDKLHYMFIQNAENVQGRHVNYLNVLQSMYAKIPFSIGQTGKAFRNEIILGNFTFRTIEFEQMVVSTDNIDKVLVRRLVKYE